MPYEEIELACLNTYQASTRASKVTTALEGKPIHAGMRMSQWLAALPAVLKADVTQGLAG